MPQNSRASFVQEARLIDSQLAIEKSNPRPTKTQELTAVTLTHCSSPTSGTTKLLHTPTLPNNKPLTKLTIGPESLKE